MPALERMRPFTIRFVNPITRRFAGHLPGFAILSYVGRRSGRRYRTPMNVFHRGPCYVFALTYGPDVDWVRNVIAAGWCDIEERGRAVRLGQPELVVDRSASLVPLPVRLFLRAMDVRHFLTMKVAGGDPPPT